MREGASCFAWVLALTACGGRGPTVRTSPSNPAPAPTTWMYRICNDTSLHIQHLFFSGKDSDDLIAGGDYGPGRCDRYANSEQLHRGYHVTFLSGDNDQHTMDNDTPELLPHGVWSFRIKLVQGVKYDIAMEVVEDHPSVWTRICNQTGEAVQLMFDGEGGPADLAAGECTRYHPTYEPPGYGAGEFVWADPEGKHVGEQAHVIAAGSRAALAPGRWTFALTVKDARTGELRRSAKPD